MKKTPSSTNKKEINPVDVLNAKHEKASWGSIAKTLGLNKGILSAVSRGKRRAPNSLIAKLNSVYGLKIPLNKIPAQPCPKCGAVHLSKKCTADKMLPEMRVEIDKFIAWARPREAAHLAESRTP